jgi:antitoxin MazE
MLTTRKINVRRMDGLLGICFPSDFAEIAHITDNSVVEVEVEEEKIVIQKEKRTYKSIEELFEGFDGEYDSEFVDWGKPVGNEVW